MEQKKEQHYIIKPDAMYSGSWLAPWAGYKITLFKKGRLKFYNLFGMVDKQSGYFTKSVIKNLLTPA